ncbi:MAG: winged helix-turn-helix transcriptional regulator [Sphingobacteriaceae bacterium]|nr:winged helix-turn-helix transcriptional regulator [Sphingobacteriaceae bacterium]
MSYNLYRQLISLTEDFEKETSGIEPTLNAFSTWLSRRITNDNYVIEEELDWEGKKNGRSAESVINTSLVHLYRYAKIYSKLAIQDSPFSTIDDVIFLINLNHLGEMSKKSLIDLNIHERTTGIQIINRVLYNGFIEETINELDRRSRKVKITAKGKDALEKNMDKIRGASKTVVGNLDDSEKLQLVRLLRKLELYHQEKLRK